MYQLQTMLSTTNTFISLKILEALMEKDLTDEDKAKIIAEGFAELEKRYPDLSNVSTKTNLSETELRLIKEIKELDVKLTKEITETRKEIKELDLKLTKEISETRKEIKELDVKLTTEIKNVDVKLTKEIKELDLKLTTEIKNVDAKLTKEIHETKKEIKELDLKLTKEIEKSKTEMIKWSFIFWISQIGVISAIGYSIFKILDKSLN